MNKILALDQSTRITGYAIFNASGNLLSYGKLNLTDNDLSERLNKFRKWLKNIIEQQEIDYVIFEDIQLQNNVVNNVKTFKSLAEVIGIIDELLFEMNIDCAAVLASTWKSTLSIRGRDRAAQKKSAQEYVLKTYDLKPTQDEADAICIGSHYFQKQDYDWTN